MGGEGKRVAERTNGQRFVLLDTRTKACPAIILDNGDEAGCRLNS